MNAVLDHPTVSHYLTELRRLAESRMPTADARELVADIEDHISTALAEGDGSEISVRQTLDRLGSPEDVVTAAVGPVAPPAPGSTRVEDAAVILFVLSLALTSTVILIPVAVVTWVAALVLLLIAKHWSGREKLLGGIVFGILGSPLTIGLAGALGVLTTGQVCTSVETAVSAVDGSGAPAQGTTPGTAVETCTGTTVPPIVLILAIVGLIALWAWTARKLWRAAHRAR